MWAFLKAILVKWALIKSLLKILGSLGWLVPLAFILKAVGLPLLILLAVLAIPLLIVLAVIGLPLILVVVVGGALLTFTMWIVSMGLLALKIALPIIAIFWVIRWLTRSRDNGTSETPPGADAA
jgi:hypothetical protein